MNIRDTLRRELSRRQRVNPRYSIRAFSRSLALSHSVISRMLNGNQRVTPATIRKVAKGLRLTAAQISDALQFERESLLLATVAKPDFRADCRWLASKTGIAVDDVNRALFPLISSGKLTLTSRAHWQHTDSE